MFDKIIGNEEIQELLEQTIRNKRASHSYLFVGTEGIGKKQIAKEFAKALLCLEINIVENVNLVLNLMIIIILILY